MRKLFTSISFATLVGVAAFAPTASADEVSDLEKQEREVAAERNEIQAKIEDADADLVNVIYEVETINNKIKNLDSSIKETEKEIKENQAEIEELETEMFKIEDRIVRRTDILKERLVAMQASGSEGQSVFIETIAGEISFAEAVSRANAIKSISDADIQLVVDLEEDQTELQEVEKELSKKQEELETAKEKEETEKKERETEKDALQKKKQELEKTVDRLGTEEQELSSLQASIRSDIQSVTVEPEPEAQPVSAREAVTASTNSGSNSNSSSNSSRSTSQGSTKKKKSTKSSNNVPAPTRNGGTAISRATSQIGKADYQLGAMSPNNRFDCSGLVGWAYGMGRENTGSLRAKSTKITEAQAQPGDLIFFGPNHYHVGIYIGNNQFVGSQSSTGPAIVNYKTDYYWSKEKQEFRRLN